MDRLLVPHIWWNYGSETFPVSLKKPLCSLIQTCTFSHLLRCVAHISSLHVRRLYRTFLLLTLRLPANFLHTPPPSCFYITSPLAVVLPWLLVRLIYLMNTSWRTTEERALPFPSSLLLYSISLLLNNPQIFQFSENSSIPKTLQKTLLACFSRSLLQGSLRANL